MSLAMHLQPWDVHRHYDQNIYLETSALLGTDDDDDNFSATSDLITVRGQWVEIASDDNNSAVIDGGGGSSGVDALFYKT